MIILTVPDPKLRLKAEPCVAVTPEISRQLFMILRQAGGLGLAAPQLGFAQRLFITENGFLFSNPRIMPHGNRVEVVESCLSIPDSSFKVWRWEKVHVETDYFNVSFEGLWSYVVQHEYDHLEGVLIDVKGHQNLLN